MLRILNSALKVKNIKIFFFSPCITCVILPTPSSLILLTKMHLEWISANNDKGVQQLIEHNFKCSGLPEIRQ